MFIGLFILNLLLNFASWQAFVIIAAAQSLIFSGTIWLVPEINIKPKSITHEYVTHKGHLRNLLVMMLIMLIQQLSGIGTLLGQVSRLLSGIGFNIGSYIESCLFDFIGGLSTMIGAFIIDQIGPRNMCCLCSNVESEHAKLGRNSWNFYLFSFLWTRCWSNSLVFMWNIVS